MTTQTKPDAVELLATPQWIADKHDSGRYEVRVPTGHSRWDFSESQAHSVAQMCREAYELGLKNKSKEIRNALGVVHEAMEALNG